MSRASSTFTLCKVFRSAQREVFQSIEHVLKSAPKTSPVVRRERSRSRTKVFASSGKMLKPSKAQRSGPYLSELLTRTP